MTSIISVANLVKQYGAHTAVDDVTFDVETGTTFAFLGTNGAGKSTTISCITTLKSPTSGRITVAGERVGSADRSIRRNIGVVFQESLLDPILSVRENLVLRARFYGLGAATARRRIGELSDLLELGGFLDRRYGKLSGGQKRRADIVRALVHDPPVLFLDEPTTGLDPDSRQKVWSTVQNLQNGLDLTIFLTTHYMAETENADQVSIIHKGAIVAAGSPDALRARFSQDELRLTLRDPARFDDMIGDDSALLSAKGNDRVIAVTSSAEAIYLLTTFERDIADFEFHHGSMDDVFLAITRDTLDRGASATTSRRDRSRA